MPPDEMNENNIQNGMVEPRHIDVDGKVWMVVSARSGFDGMQRLDTRSGAFERFDVYHALRGEASPVSGGGEGEVPGRNMYAGPAHGTYGIATDSRNNVYFCDFANTEVGLIGRIDAKTKKLDWFHLPTPYARPRRLFMDSHDQLWIAEFRSNKIAMFDTKSEHFEEWDVPAGNYPYYVVGDKNGEAWAGSVFNDRILRLNPGTKEIVEYLLPRSTNIRRMYVDNSTTPVTIWAGNNHGASIVKVEPLD
jgi:virginiamycin B lyase